MKCNYHRRRRHHNRILTKTEPTIPCVYRCRAGARVYGMRAVARCGGNADFTGGLMLQAHNLFRSVDDTSTNSNEPSTFTSPPHSLLGKELLAN